MSLTIIAEPSVRNFFEGDVDVADEGLCRDVGLDRAVFCGQLAAQCPGCPHFKHFEAACPLDTIVPVLDCHLPRPFLFFPFPFDFGGRGDCEVGEAAAAPSASATTG